MENEYWVDLVGFESLYSVSNTGMIRANNVSFVRKNGIKFTKKEIILKQSVNNKNGYAYVNLNKNGLHYLMLVHRAVALSFIPSISDKPYVNHKDGNKLNNNLSNLEWCDRSYNMKHAYENNLINRSMPKGYNSACSKPIELYDLSGVLIGEYGSQYEASRLSGFSLSSILRSLKGVVEKPRFGYWKYRDNK